MMTHTSPLLKLHHDLPMIRFGAAPGVDVIATFGELESEYAAIRKGCILMDMPQRATIVVRGGDRLEFLNRMLTQELKPTGQWIAPWNNVRSFWLNRKGRIDADLRCIELPAGTLGETPCMVFDVDVLTAPVLIETLGAFILMDDVTLEDATPKMHRLALHGPSSAALLAENSIPIATHIDAPRVSDLQPQQATIVSIAGHDVIVDRMDSTGEIGLELLMQSDAVEEVWDTLSRDARTDFGHNNDPATNTHRLRLAGWHAYNIARLEAGKPLYHIDFSSTNLPAETGVLNDRVSFTKGCYLGQEVVARMQSLGHPKQGLVALRLDGDATDEQPEAGASVRASTETDAPVIGGITSSVRSPMLGDSLICFAQVKWKHRDPGTVLFVQSTTGHVRATAQDQLAFWSRIQA